MRGPWTQPPSIASCKATSSKLEEPTLRTVVKPALSVLAALATPTAVQKLSVNFSP